MYAFRRARSAPELGTSEYRIGSTPAAMSGKAPGCPALAMVARSQHPSPSGDLDLPDEVEEVFRRFFTCELSTLSRDGTPVTWPVGALWHPERQCFLVSTSVGLPQKALNIRRDPRISMLFSDRTGSGLTDPAAILIQGRAEAPDVVRTSLAGVEPYWLRIFEGQPKGRLWSSTAVMRHFFDWYFIRLYLYVSPERLFVWHRGDFSATPDLIEVPRAA
jgi:hypothetical protein